MRRAALAIVSTIAGLVLLLGFKTHGTAAVGGATAALAPATTGGASTGGAATSPPPAAAPSTTAAPSKAAAPTPASRTQTVAGRTYDTMYGPVQVQVTVTNGRLTNVAALQLPQGSGRDIEIDNVAVPQLRDEALSAQSAHIDMVSGATYTSDGYIRSLQSALDQVHA